MVSFSYFRKGQFLGALAAVVFCALAFPSSAAAYDRIVSLYSGHTDNIIALGGADRLVGISANDEPARLPDVTRFPMKTNVEAILSVHPDLVLMRTLNKKRNPGMADLLTQAGVRVVLLDPPSWDGFENYLRTLAPLTGADPDNAAALLDKARREIAAEAEKRRAGRPSPTVFVEATAKEFRTCSPGSWAAHLIALAGGTNAAGDATPVRKGSSIAPWGLERTLRLASSGLDIYLIQHGPMNRTTPEEIAARPWKEAFSHTEIVQIPEYLLSRPSLPGLTEGGKRLIGIFFKE